MRDPNLGQKVPSYVPQRCGKPLRNGPNKGKPCGRWALQGASVCARHGGQLPAVRRKAAQRVAALKADHFLTKNSREIEPVDDPIEYLQRLAGEAWAAKDYFAAQIEKLRYASSNTGEQLRAEVALYERALDRCMKVLAEITKLGISERRIKIAEAQAVMLMAVIDRVLDRLELTDTQRTIAGTVIAEEFEQIAGELD